MIKVNPISKNNIFNRIVALAVLVAIMAMTLPVSVYAETYKEYPVNMTLHVDGGNGITVRALDLYYPNYRHLSMRDVAMALSGTSKSFEMSIGEKVYITTGQTYGVAGGENVPFDEEVFAADYMFTDSLKRTSIEKDGWEYRYYAFIKNNSSNKADCYMYVTDLAMLLDLNITMEGNDIYIDTSRGFEIDMDGLDDNGYFWMTNGALIGDITTGEIFYSFNGSEGVAMASTTKLMTYLLVMDAVSSGQLSLDSELPISYRAERLSKSVDGVIWLTEGQTVTLRDALAGMLLPSSNELALVMAEAVAGSEEDFVARMNQKAAEIGLSSETRFYNSCGLPYFINDAMIVKTQNRISAEDMFKLVSYIMLLYPQITDITSQRELELPSLGGQVVKNTNPLLYNLPGTIGLKTGTTNKAGNCLVALYPCDVNGERHLLLSVELGAENTMMRGTVSEVLMHYGIQCLGGNPTPPETELVDVPTTAEGLVQLFLNR